MKVDFREAVKELRRTGDLQVRDMHANLVQEIVTGLQEAIEPDLLAATFSPPSLTPTDTYNDSSLPSNTTTSTLQMNATVTDSTIMNMQQ